MVRTLHQRVTFRAPPETLFDLYMDARKHTAATGGKAAITRKVGAPFSAWDGYIEGENLAVVPKRLIVQRWRASDWSDVDADSTLVLAFAPGPRGGGVVDLVHVGVPDDAADALDEGWHDFYWKPWRAYLAARGKK